MRAALLAMFGMCVAACPSSSPPPTQQLAKERDARVKREDKRLELKQYLAVPCQDAYRAETPAALARLVSQPTGGLLRCVPDACQSSAAVLSPALSTRPLGFGTHTTALEGAVAARLRASLSSFFPSATVTVDEGAVIVRWRDSLAHSPEERELRDTYKVMGVTMALSLRWQPCPAGDAACSVLPQAETSLLALTPRAGTQDTSCSLYFGAPDALGVKGLSGASNTARRLQAEALRALQDELLLLGLCGDNSVQNRFEGCDDGNIQNGDGCSSLCQQEAPYTQ